ncbi:hypothetical protein FISHEDRAFT_73076 [Fistulina hepatica ATCC 64428]|uniref:Uncharacterized protein n=1 Tax=Fistulina hepatica ATCC 64428 TaxID=1128425 RepID=A0A0D7ADD1_9AGAR|nr:hypothetical protein FISHEDRAFT_73076 [Fistulina hepatica ATCC 64428]
MHPRAPPHSYLVAVRLSNRSHVTLLRGADHVICAPCALIILHVPAHVPAPSVHVPGMIAYDHVITRCVYDRFPRSYSPFWARTRFRLHLAAPRPYTGAPALREGSRHIT